jgi:CHAD domain-containing protein
MRPSLLESSAEHGARLVALRALDQAAAASERLHDPTDVEALHDFRVAVRRLRSLLRAYEDVLDEAVPRPQRRRLARLAKRTGPGRDAEVQLEWIEALTSELDPLEAPGVEWARDAITADRDQAYAAVRERVMRRFDKLEPRLREGLAVYQVTVDLGDPSPRRRFVDLVLEALPAELDALRVSMETLREDTDLEVAHRARLAGKRVRYLLEPLRDEVPEAKERVRELRRLQDALGALNDLHTLSARVGKAIEDAALDGARRLREAALGTEPVDVDHVMRTDARRGLLALLQRARTETSTRLARVRTEWLDEGRLAQLLEGLEGMASRLAQEPGVEIASISSVRCRRPARGSPSWRSIRGTCPARSSSSASAASARRPARRTSAP